MECLSMGSPAYSSVGAHEKKRLLVWPCLLICNQHKLQYTSAGYESNLLRSNLSLLLNSRYPHTPEAPLGSWLSKPLRLKLKTSSQWHHTSRQNYNQDPEHEPASGYEAAPGEFGFSLMRSKSTSKVTLGTHWGTYIRGLTDLNIKRSFHVLRKFLYGLNLLSE